MNRDTRPAHDDTPADAKAKARQRRLDKLRWFRPVPVAFHDRERRS
jgi:hypothetical protein